MLSSENSYSQHQVEVGNSIYKILSFVIRIETLELLTFPNSLTGLGTYFLNPSFSIKAR